MQYSADSCSTSTHLFRKDGLYRATTPSAALLMSFIVKTKTVILAMPAPQCTFINFKIKENLSVYVFFNGIGHFWQVNSRILAKSSRLATLETAESLSSSLTKLKM